MNNRNLNNTDLFDNPYSSYGTQMNNQNPYNVYHNYTRTPTPRHNFIPENYKNKLRKILIPSAIILLIIGVIQSVALAVMLCCTDPSNFWKYKSRFDAIIDNKYNGVPIFEKDGKWYGCIGNSDWVLIFHICLIIFSVSSPLIFILGITISSVCLSYKIRSIHSYLVSTLVLSILIFIFVPGILLLLSLPKNKRNKLTPSQSFDYPQYPTQYKY